VAHDRFQEIIDEANNPDSVIRTGVLIGRDVAKEKREAVAVEPNIMAELARTEGSDGEQGGILFPTPADKEVAKITIGVLRDFERLPTSRKLAAPEIQEEISRRVEALYMPKQGELVKCGQYPFVVPGLEPRSIRAGVVGPELMVQPDLTG